MLATCSFDRTAAVWEEVAGEDPNAEAEKRNRLAQEKRLKKQQQQGGSDSQQNDSNAGNGI